MAKIREKGLIAKKVGMTRMVDARGQVIPVTLLKVEDQKVTKILTSERDGYTGYQVGYFVKAKKNLTKPDLGRMQKVSVEECYSNFKEFRTKAQPSVEVGAVITAELFQDITSVDITGITKGRGFQGAVKKWGSAIGRMTHGSRFHRRPGSLGMNSTPARVMKNKHQPGHMGVEIITMKNMQVVDVDVEQNVIAIKGSVPGHREGFVEIRPTNKVIKRAVASKG